MNGLVLALAHDAPGKHDASSVFLPGAAAFSRLHGLPPATLIDNTRPLSARLKQTLETVAYTPGPLNVVAYFGHGWHSGCALGVAVPTLHQFAAALASQSARELTVLLYACSTGEDEREAGGRSPDHADVPGAGDGSFADGLRDALCDLGVAATVYAHATLGHAMRNPYARRFGPEIRAGGEYVVAPDAPEWHAWVHALATSDLWARFPWMTRDEITDELLRQPLTHRA